MRRRRSTRISPGNERRHAKVFGCATVLQGLALRGFYGAAGSDDECVASGHIPFAGCCEARIDIGLAFRMTFLNNLGNGFRLRYYRTGDLDDLDWAIQAYEDAAAGRPGSSGRTAGPRRLRSATGSDTCRSGRGSMNG